MQPSALVHPLRVLVTDPIIDRKVLPTHHLYVRVQRYCIDLHTGYRTIITRWSTSCPRTPRMSYALPYISLSTLVLFLDGGGMRLS